MPNGDQFIPQQVFVPILNKDIESSSDQYIKLFQNVYYEDYKKYAQLTTRCESLQRLIEEYEDHESIVKNYVITLYEMGYLKHADPYTLTNQDLTIKGILATEIKQCIKNAKSHFEYIY